MNTKGEIMNEVAHSQLWQLLECTKQYQPPFIWGHFCLWSVDRITPHPKFYMITIEWRRKKMSKSTQRVEAASHQMVWYNPAENKLKQNHPKLQNPIIKVKSKSALNAVNFHIYVSKGTPWWEADTVLTIIVILVLKTRWKLSRFNLSLDAFHVLLAYLAF